MTEPQNNELTINGRPERWPTPAPGRLARIITGFQLLVGSATLLLRFVMGARAKGVFRINPRGVTVEMEHRLFGKPQKKVSASLPFNEVKSVATVTTWPSFHKLAGVTCFVIGMLFGVQWILEGLGAGYPYLALLGAGVLFLGLVLDFALYVLIPGAARVGISIETTTHTYRLTGVNREAAIQFQKQVTSRFSRTS